MFWLEITPFWQKSFPQKFSHRKSDNNGTRWIITLNVCYEGYPAVNRKYHMQPSTMKRQAIQQKTVPAATPDLPMMTPSNGNIFRVTGHWCGEINDQWIPLTKASDAEIWWVFFICAWINGWVNNRGADYLRHHRTYHDVIVMHISIRWTA